MSNLGKIQQFWEIACSDGKLIIAFRLKESISSAIY